MKPLKHLSLLLLLATLLVPLKSPAHTAEANTSSGKESRVIIKVGLFSFLKKDTRDAYRKNMEKKRKLAKAHRRTLLRKARRSKSY